MPNEIQVKTILNKTKKRDSWFLDDYTVNPYSSCSFNCLYCYIRGSKYGFNLEEKVSIKTNAIELLEKELANKAKKGKYGIIVVSSATDPYLHLEEKYGLTRKILELILKYRFPVHIITKSPLVLRDMDLLAKINFHGILPEDLRHNLAGKTIISFSFSTVDDDLAKIFEPNAPLPSERIEAIRILLEKGFHCGISMMPILPFVMDSEKELNKVFRTFKQLQVKYILPASLTLFGQGSTSNKTLVLDAIQKHYPEYLDKYKEFFRLNSQIPPYYHKFFQGKIKRFLREYQLHNSILNPPLDFEI
jgi:DNA repair photolyase